MNHPDLTLPTGFTARPLTMADLDAAAAVAGASERGFLGDVVMGVGTIGGKWRSPSFDFENSRGVFLDDRLVAWAELRKYRQVTVMVHPDHRGKGLGTALADWVERHAALLGSDRVDQEAPEKDVDALSIYAARGYEHVFTTWVLELAEGQTIPERPLPDAVSIRPYEPGEEREAHEIVENAFSAWEGRDWRSFHDWKAQVMDEEGFSAENLLVAVRDRTDDDVPHDEDVVGACVVFDHGHEGWVHQLAVDDSERGNGLGQALLHAAFTASRERGTTVSRLDTDSRGQAIGLYEKLGMTVVHTFENWEKRLLPEG